MKSEIKTLWLEALRSDKYKQGTCALNRMEEEDCSYCCLGVLCEIAHEHGLISKHLNEDEMVFVYNEEDEVLPEEVKNWAGLNYCSPRCKYDNKIVPFTELNDDYKLNFKEIADIIEEQL